MIYTIEDDVIIERIDPILDENGNVKGWNGVLNYPAHNKAFLNYVDAAELRPLESYTEAMLEDVRDRLRLVTAHHEPFIHTGEGVPLGTFGDPE